MISVDTKERFDKIQHPFSLKTKGFGSYDKDSFCRIQVCDWGSFLVLRRTEPTWSPASPVLRWPLEARVSLLAYWANLSHFH